MQLEQITIEFVAEQDRLLMRLAGDGRSEVLLWLTRRCVKLLWPQLVKLAESTPGIAVQPAPEARQALLDSMIAQRVVASEAARRHLFMTRGAVIEAITQAPEFQENGEFSDRKSVV